MTSSARNAPTSGVTIPDGYTFIDTDTFVSKGAWDTASKLLRHASRRDPDEFGLDLGNDFHGYGVIDLLDVGLRSLHKKIGKQQWMPAFYEVEALAIFMDFKPDWGGIDDSTRVTTTNKVFGACVANVLRALKEQNKLDLKHIPNLENVLRVIADCNVHLEENHPPPYASLCRAIAKRLFDDKWEDLKELHKERVEVWKATLSEQERAALSTTDEDEETAAEDDDDSDDGGKWFDDVEEGSENFDQDAFNLEPLWVEYQSNIPPRNGTESWDITTWSAEELKEAQNRNNVDNH